VTTAVKAAKNPACSVQECRAMPVVDEDDRPKRKISHEIGQDLALISAAELTERIQLLKEEIARLEADMARKRAMKSAADNFFKK
jgi:uncharacterized small protein (DUF1192 family)